LITIVTGFVTQLPIIQAFAQDPVATHSNGAVVQARIAIGLVAIITGLVPRLPRRHIGPANSISTLTDRAVVKTSVRIGLIAIITGLCPGFSRRNIISDDTVTAAGNRTTICQASIRIDHIAVVASLSLLHDPITASGEITEVTAVIIIDLITIVAGLDPVVDNVVATASGSTTVRARVAVHRIGIITRFVTGVAFNQVRTDHAITAASILAIVPTRVEILLVTVVTGFPSLKDFIPTSRVIAEV